MNWKFVAAIALAMASVVAFAPTETRAQTGEPVRVGLLTCQVDGSRGHLLGSRRELSCIFENVGGGPIEHYAGEIRRIGIDVGSTSYSDIAWAVFSLAEPYAPGALQGTYAGLSAGVAIGYGLGANLLIGGLERSFALQPISVETTQGFNLAIGVAALNLLSTGEFR